MRSADAVSGAPSNTTKPAITIARSWLTNASLVAVLDGSDTCKGYTGTRAAAMRRAPTARRRLFFRVELERGRIHAVTLTGRFGAVIEHVPEMRFASGAQHLGAAHEQRVVRFLAYVFLADRRIERRPARTGVEFRIGFEQRRAATDAA